MLAINLRDEINNMINKHGEDVEILYTGEQELLVCFDTGSTYEVIETLDID